MNRQHIVAQLLLRSWPFLNGAGRVADRFFGSLTFSDQIDTIRTTDNFDMTVMLDDLIGRHLYLMGKFDRSIVNVLCRFAQPGDTLVDIGANIGYVSASFLTRVPESTVAAIEPQPEILELLRQNLVAFPGRSVIFPYAISDHNGKASFHVDQANRGASRITETGGIKVDIRTADSFFREAKLNKVDLVKIDVEGHEEEVIRSCQPHFARLRPRAILFEDHGQKSATSIGVMLREIGYEIFGLKKTLTRVDMLPIRSPKDCICNDYIAIRDYNMRTQIHL